MSGFRNGTLYARNVDFSNAAIATPQVTANGQLLIGSAVAPNIRVGSLTSTSGTVTITTGNGTINLETASAGVFWQVIGSSMSLAPKNGYFCTSGGALSLALPAISAVGDTIDVILDGATSFTITQPNAASIIRFGNLQTTLGVGGSLASTDQGDSIRLVCETANAKWVIHFAVGNLTVT